MRLRSFDAKNFNKKHTILIYLFIFIFVTLFLALL